MQAQVRVVGIAEHHRAGAVGSDVPGVEFGNGAHFARGPVHHTQRAWPDRENQIAGAAEERLVYHELIVAVLVQTLETRAIAAHAMHARRRIARELDPLGLERMKLWMNHGTRKRDQLPAGAIRASGDQALLRALFDGRGDPSARRSE